MCCSLSSSSALIVTVCCCRFLRCQGREGVATTTNCGGVSDFSTMAEEAEQRKTAKCSKETPRDWLSNLSDDLICHILSFLPTKDAYRTSILSTRWASLCTKVPDLHFLLPNFEYVNTVLLRRTQNIRKLRLHIFRDRCKPHHVNLWILKALDLGVEELDLDLRMLRTTLLPRKLFTSESLVVLKLQSNIRLTLPSFVYLPCLKILHLLLITQCGSPSAFLTGCPRLEELCLNDYVNLKHPLNTSSLFFKRLCLRVTHLLHITNPLQINVPSLEELDITDYSFRKYEIVNLSNVHRATLCISKNLDFHSLHRLLHGLSNVKSLCLTSSTIEFLSKDNLDNVRLLQFHNLLYLKVEIPEKCCWDVIVSFLQNAPLLRDLVIEKDFKRNSKRSVVGNSGWMGPPITPICLSASLKTLQFSGIQNIKVELDFTRYIIENSSKLEKVKIFTPVSKKSKEATSLVERNLLKGKNKSPVIVWDIINTV